MQIAGLEKLSLIDYPNKLSAIIFLFGCNFRCGFCHNPELVLPEKCQTTFSEQKVLDFLEKRKKYLDGLCVTGGEPLINNDLPEFLKKVKDRGYLIKVDTNGTNPKLLKEIIDQGLIDFIAMDIKADKDNYDLLAGTSVDLSNIEESIKIIMDSGLDCEFRTTVIRGYHNKKIMESLGKWIGGLGKPKKLAVQKFLVREGKLIDEKFENIKEFKDEEMEELADSVEDYFEEVEIR